MAGGKETPRQKMIGLMYLVLTAMLALNVSKAVLWGYISVSESMDKSLKNIAFSNTQISEAFKASIDGNPKAAPYYEEAVKAEKMLNDMVKYVDDVKGNIIRDVLKIPEGTKVLGDTVKLRWDPVKNAVDNYDKPTYLMLGSEAHSEQDGPLRAKELKAKLNELHDKLVAQLEQMQKTDGKHLLQPDYESLKKKYAIIKPTDSGREEDKLKYTWAMDNFYHLPLGAVFVNMQKIQIDIKNAETEMLQSFSGASGKLAIKPDQLSAKVLAASNYISAGGKYQADIILLASFSKLNAGDMEVMMGVDSAAAVKGAKGNPIPVVNGVGKYEVNAGAPGDVKYQGVVKFKKPDGTFEYYPFAQEYKVAPSAVAVSADMMQVFYRGVENPVSASVAGRSPQDIVISPSGAGVKYTQTGPGKYIFTFSGLGECLVTVSAKEQGGIKPQGAPVKFKVKPLPQPQVKLGQAFAPEQIKLSQLQTLSAIGAGAANFDFKANYIVQSYEIYAKVKSQPRYAQGQGSNLAQDALNIVRNADPSSKLVIDIRVKGPDGQFYNATSGIKVVR